MLARAGQGNDMHENLQEIRDELQLFLAHLQSVIQNHNTPFSVLQSNWSFPGVSSEDIRLSVHHIVEMLDTYDQAELDDDSITHLKLYPGAIRFAKDQTLPNVEGNGQHAIPALLIMFESLRRALARALKTGPDDAAKAASSMRQIRTRLGALEKTIAQLEPRSSDVEAKVARIEQAHDAADRLPADLEQLEDAHKQIKAALADANEHLVHIKLGRQSGEEATESLRKLRDEARAVVERCNQAYAAATSQGLAAAFSERSKSLNLSMLYWVVGLVTALVVGGWLGHSNAIELAELLKADAKAPAIVVRAMISVIALVGPVWFAWLATKQINQNFRLSEDYGFKASISRAYEGYRNEAARIDSDLEAMLLKSALGRLDELPLRLVENSNHGSPWQEILSSDVVKDAVRTVPNFSASVVDIAKASLGRITRKTSQNTEQGQPPTTG